MATVFLGNYQASSPGFFRSPGPPKKLLFSKSFGLNHENGSEGQNQSMDQIFLAVVSPAAPAAAVKINFFCKFFF